VLIKENLAAATLALPVTLKARLTVDRELVRRQIRGEQIGSIETVQFSQVGLHRTLVEKLIEGANTFTRHYATKGYQALTPPSEFIVWGPYASRFTGVTARPTTSGFADGENPFPDSADFVIEGKFLATRGKVPEFAS